VAVRDEPDDEPTSKDIWQAVSVASAFVRHAETIAQTRFNNYLVADSLLLLAWATIFAGQRSGYSQLVLIVLAALSAVLSLFWIILGTRAPAKSRFVPFVRWPYVVAR
jgi:tryptophan-rich sensory protein